MISAGSFTGSPPLPPPDLLDLVEDVNDSTVTGFQDAVLQWYLYQGYPFSSMGCFLAGPDSLVASVVPGRHASLEDIWFEGLEKTAPATLERLYRGGFGVPYDPAAVDDWRRRMERLPFVAWVPGFYLVLGPGGNLVLVQPVVEGSSGSFSASLGATGGESPEGEGLLEVTNLLGTGRELDISLSSSSWGGTDASGRYLEPWIAGLPLSAEIALAQEVPDSAWLNREVELAAIWEAGSNLEVRSGAGRWWGYSPMADRTYRYGLVGLLYTPGTMTQAGWEGASVSLEGRMGMTSGPDSSGILAQSVLSARLDMFEGMLGFGGEVLAGGILEGAPLWSRLTRLGGAGSVRGWPENSFRAVRYLVARPEVSIGETTTRLYVFTDLAAVRTVLGDRFPAGAGAGLRGRSGQFVMDASVGFPLRGGPARFYLSAAAEVF